MSDTSDMPLDGESERRPTGRDEVVASLTAAARELFSQRGIDQVSVRQIAQAAGVNAGLVHRHFDGKESLITACFADDAIEARSALAGIDSPDEAARGLFAEALARPAFVKILASAMLGSIGAEIVLPAHGPVTYFRDVVYEAREDDDAMIDFLVATAAGMGWVLFGPILQMLAGEDLPDQATVEARLADRFAAIAEGKLVED